MKRVKHILQAAFSITIVTFTAISAWTAESTKDTPIMVIPEKVFQFNEVKEGMVLKHTFKVLNQGTQVLTIKRVKPG